MCSNKKSANEKELYDLVLKEINNQIKKYYNQKIIEKNYYEQRVKNSIEKELELLKKEKIKVEKNIMNKENVISLLYEDRVNGLLDIKEFQIIKSKNVLDISNYKERLNQIDKEISGLNIKKSEKLDTEEILKKYSNIEILNRNILDEFISEIHIGFYNPDTQTRKIKIVWNINAL